MILVPNELAQLVANAVRAAQAAGDLPAFELPPVEIKPPKKAEQGDYAAAVAMQLARPAGMNPFAIATKISHHLAPADFIGAVEVVHPGFINFRLSERWLREQVEAIIAAGEQLYQLDLGAGQRAQVEFVSANPTGPLHVGRSRGAIVGDSIARILEAAGYSVEREYYFNNAGAQMRNLGNSLRIRYRQALSLPVEIPDDGTFYQGAYLTEMANQLAAERGAALAEADWQPFKEYAEKRMFELIRATLRRVDIHHDVFFNENSLYDSGAVEQTLAALRARGYIYESAEWEGADATEQQQAADKAPAVWFRSTAFGDTKDRVLVKHDGEPTYTLPDIAYHINKLERGFDLLVNILGADHYVQHQVVRNGVQALGYDESKIHVIIIQFVRLLRQGQEVKMSTRAGEIETLDDLIDQTSADAVRYLLLARSPDARIDFDLDAAIAQSNENPVYYIQNAHVRCAGIFRQAAEAGLSDADADLSLLGAGELAFVRKALELGEQIEYSARSLEPHRIAFYAHELAAAFHPIYDNVRVLHSDVSPELARARLRFYRAAQVTFQRVLTLLGMSAPDVM